MVIAMSGGTLCNTPYQLITLLLVEAWRLKTVSAKNHDRTATLARFLFGCGKESTTIALSLLVWMYPEELHFAHTGPRVSTQACDNLVLFVPH